MYLLSCYNVYLLITILDSTFNYLMSQLTLSAIHLLLIITTYSY